MGARLKALVGLTMAGLAVFAVTAPAAHADPVDFEFCNNHGNVPNPTEEYVAFPYHGWSRSPVESSGQCWSTSLSGVSSDEAVGYRLVNGQWLAVTTRYFNDSWMAADIVF